MAWAALAAILALSAFIIIVPNPETGRSMLAKGPWMRFAPSFMIFVCGSLVLRGWLAVCGFCAALLEFMLFIPLFGEVPAGCLCALIVAGWRLWLDRRRKNGPGTLP